MSKKYTLDAAAVAKEIVKLVDDRGPGLSVERERQIETAITKILEAHVVEKESKP